MGVPRCSVVVPLYNEEAVLPELYRRLARVLRDSDGPAEMIFVDDGSRDATLDRLKAFAHDAHRIRIVSLSRNFGHQAAVTAGLAYAQGDAVAIIDGDLQDPPELLPQLFSKLREGWDVVYGVRQARKEGPGKRLGYHLFY